MSDIDLIPVSRLSGMNFFIPSYQRGYRWTEQQVKDLLNDINEFNPKGDSYYCLQPVVVKEITKEKEKYGLWEGEWYEVIDGQQRLTTIFLILKFLKAKPERVKGFEWKVWSEYHLSYETRRGQGKDSWEFLSNIDEENDAGASKNIDFYHMWKAYETIENWWNRKEKEEGKNFDGEYFAEKILKNTRFIWYRTREEDSIKVFTRMNIGKIPLTNAELIKALFLNRSNFSGGNDEYIRLRQLEIASEWDGIEYTLQNEEFWLFIHNKGYTNPTRIDFIFDLIFENDKLVAREKILENHKRSMEWGKIIGTDEYRPFRYFYEYFQLEDEPDKMKNCWNLVKKYFQTFKEWYDDLEFYHYVGFLIDRGEKVMDLLDDWGSCKTKKSEKNESFRDCLCKKIKDKIKVKNLKEQYGEERSGIRGLDRTDCRSLLLLHNIQTVINQGKNATGKYGRTVFYKFPFHIYKTEKWNVEHIDSNTPNPEDDIETQKEWLRNVGDVVGDDRKKEIDDFIKGECTREYEDIKDDILRELGDNNEGNRLNDEEKNQIMNFTLLDESTNKGYGNSIFAVKRRKIVEKDKGENGTAFIPPCTKSVFLKYYSATSPSPNYWYKSDAEAYRGDISNTLKDFLSKEEQNNAQ